MSSWSRYRIVVTNESDVVMLDEVYGGAGWVDALWQCALNRLRAMAAEGCAEQVLLPLRNAVSGAQSVARAVDLRRGAARTDPAIRAAVRSVREATRDLDHRVWNLWRDRCWRP